MELMSKRKRDKLRAKRSPLDRARVEAITAALAALPVIDSRSPEEILGYNEIGIPG